MAGYGRPGADRRGRLPLHHRSGQGPDHPQRAQHRSQGGGGSLLPPSPGAGSRRGGAPRQLRGRSARGLRAAGGRGRHRRGPAAGRGAARHLGTRGRAQGLLPHGRPAQVAGRQNPQEPPARRRHAARLRQGLARRRHRIGLHADAGVRGARAHPPGRRAARCAAPPRPGLPHLPEPSGGAQRPGPQPAARAGRRPARGRGRRRGPGGGHRRRGRPFLGRPRPEVGAGGAPQSHRGATLELRRGTLPRILPAPARPEEADHRAGAGRLHRRRLHGRQYVRPHRLRRQRLLLGSGGPLDGHGQPGSADPSLGDGHAQGQGTDLHGRAPAGGRGPADRHDQPRGSRRGTGAGHAGPGQHHRRRAALRLAAHGARWRHLRHQGRQRGEEERVLARDDGAARPASDALRRGRQPVGGGAVRRRRAHHGGPGHAEVLRPDRHCPPAAGRLGGPVRLEAAHHQAGDRRGAGNHLHHRHRDHAGLRHRGGRRHGAFRPAGIAPGHRAAGRRALPLPDPHGLGQRHVPPVPVRGIRRAARVGTGLRAGSRALRPAAGPGAGPGAPHLPQRAAGHPRHQGSRAEIPGRRRAGRDRLHSADPGKSLRLRGLQGRHPVLHRAARSPLPGALACTGPRGRRRRCRRRRPAPPTGCRPCGGPVRASPAIHRRRAAGRCPPCPGRCRAPTAAPHRRRVPAAPRPRWPARAWQRWSGFPGRCGTGGPWRPCPAPARPLPVHGGRPRRSAPRTAADGWRWPRASPGAAGRWDAGPRRSAGPWRWCPAPAPGIRPPAVPGGRGDRGGRLRAASCRCCGPGGRCRTSRQTACRPRRRAAPWRCAAARLRAPIRCGSPAPPAPPSTAAIPPAAAGAAWRRCRRRSPRAGRGNRSAGHGSRWPAPARAARIAASASRAVAAAPPWPAGGRSVSRGARRKAARTPRSRRSGGRAAAGRCRPRTVRSGPRTAGGSWGLRGSAASGILA
uniref:LigA n=1 Tax=Parastrongyloides trichosuri TaxID=131310 RepID=A0A0N4ZCU7_PARTI